ncbi:hypothetical protein [Knoellia sp. Soil729]|uniref:hypothetical protein n=1 Tax=Knoellia sp. Soil729 TaxID=1736394 RepID=UPI000A88B455|nr:hypothetical protein [Knoellia sp. Soil729]
MSRRPLRHAADCTTVAGKTATNATELAVQRSQFQSVCVAVCVASDDSVDDLGNQWHKATSSVGDR